MTDRAVCVRVGFGRAALARAVQGQDALVTSNFSAIGGERAVAPEGLDQADGRLNRTRQTPGAAAVCKHPTPDAEGSDATRLPRDHQNKAGSALPT